jgi:hypothetical protein
VTARQAWWLAFVGWLLVSFLVLSKAQETESALGSFPLPIPVGMTQPCPGYVLAVGVVTSSGNHELRGRPASVEIGGYTLMVPNPDLPTWLRVIEANGHAYELVVRPVKPRVLNTVKR